MAKAGQTLYRLQLLDTELSEQLSKLREMQGLLGESSELLAARQTYEQASKELASWQSRVHDLEFDLQRINDKIAATEHRLYSGSVINPKELSGLQRDHEYLKRSREKLEDELLLAMTHLEESERLAADASTKLKDVESKWHREQDHLIKQIEQLQARIATLEKDRAGLAALLKRDDLSLYEELLQKKGGRAVVLLIGQMCQGCRVTVPTSKAQLVRQGQQLITCTNCGRILVMEQ